MPKEVQEAQALLSRPHYNIPGVQTFNRQELQTLRNAFDLLLEQNQLLTGFKEGALEANEIKRRLAKS